MARRAEVENHDTRAVIMARFYCTMLPGIEQLWQRETGSTERADLQELAPFQMAAAAD